ncbi:class I SAM-dependent methyltransferase [Candidatus Absconditicoccus praedator]|uniref:class I SAM-dependent methyltransferase n=1 Tax=Candidatus Absconditicoccus praedator TaxID=2735562 RepID=UPI001E5E7700|nr:class I SAM-dependent methyltransferase [Candidatus Absconditicoccus praedator]UFX83298.1 class I SAM-dependent methyltransferase [Candidatus Absconditicoccus praedator]
MENKELIKKWNKYYNKNKTSVDWGFYKPDQHVVDFLNYYDFTCNLKALDVGCGHGKNSYAFFEKGINYYGIDFAKEPIEYAYNNISSGKFIFGDILSINFNLKFDIIVDAGCFHVNEKQKGRKILKKYKEIIKSTGKIFIRVFKARKIINHPLFYIDSELPVWGYTYNEIYKILSQDFFIEKSIYDPFYYKEDEILYFYLSK